MPEDLSDIIRSLRVKRADHQASVEMLDKAIAELQRLQVKESRTQAPADEPEDARNQAHLIDFPEPPLSSAGPSMKTIIMELAEESDGELSARDVVRVCEQRGYPLNANRPLNAVLTVMGRLVKDGRLVRVAQGRYVAASRYHRGAESLGRVEGSRWMTT